MLWTRWIIYGLPLALVLLTLWSAGQARMARTIKGQSELVVASADATRPSLNPYRLETDAARELAGLLHEPLVRVDEHGQLARGLAERWSWSQTVSFWFAQERFALQAAKKLTELDAAQRARWNLTLVDVVGTELRLYFSTPHPQTGQRMMETVAEFGPLPVETVRVALAEDGAQGHHQFFMQNAVERAQVKDVWHDGARAYELQVSGEALRFYEELKIYYQNRPELKADIRVVAKRPLLTRSTMELQIREGATFHDGKPVTSGDVESTLRLVSGSGWPVPGRDALRRVHTFETADARSVRLTFREPYGAMPAALVDLPVLPAAWIERHGRDALLDATFTQDPPPGTGPYRLAEALEERVRVAELDGTRQVQFVFGRTPANIRSGFAMNAVDAFWPAPANLPVLEGDARVAVQPGPLRSQLLVLWNCRKPPLENVAVREALGLMVDREKLLQETLGASGAVYDGIYRPGMWYAKARPANPPDVPRARQMLYQMGWTTDAQEHLVRENAPFRFELLTVQGNASRQGLAERLVEAWQAQGIQVKVTAVSWDDLVGDRLPRHDFDAVLLGLDHEVSWDQSAFWHSSQATTGLNYSGVSSRALDISLDALRVETDLGRVQSLAEEAEARVMALHPFLPLFSSPRFLAIRREAFPGLTLEHHEVTLAALLQALEDSKAGSTETDTQEETEGR